MKLETGWVEYQSAGQGIPAFFARPLGVRTPLPAVIVIHELYGVEEHIEDLTQRFAAAGYEALAPDLWGAGGARPEALTRARVAALRDFLNANPAAWSGAQGREEALGRVAEPERGRLAAKLGGLFGSDEGRPARFARYTEILRGAVAHLRAGAQGTANRKIGSVGFCLGGGLSGLLAATEPTLRAAVIFYGSPPAADKIPGVGCPVLGHYADPDPRITPNIPAFAEAMRASGKDFEHHIYNSAPHAFFNDTSGAYRPDAARMAWARTLWFLLRHLS
jgi:carboxymethylenebutenolidase